VVGIIRRDSLELLHLGDFFLAQSGRRLWESRLDRTELDRDDAGEHGGLSAETPGSVSSLTSTFLVLAPNSTHHELYAPGRCLHPQHLPPLNNGSRPAGDGQEDQDDADS